MCDLSFQLFCRATYSKFYTIEYRLKYSYELEDKEYGIAFEKNMSQQTRKMKIKNEIKF